MTWPWPHDEQQARLDDAFNRIEETILPCIAMMLDTLLDASANLADSTPRRSPPNCRHSPPSSRN